MAGKRRVWHYIESRAAQKTLCGGLWNNGGGIVWTVSANKVLTDPDGCKTCKKRLLARQTYNAKGDK